MTAPQKYRCLNDSVHPVGKLKAMRHLATLRSIFGLTPKATAFHIGSRLLAALLAVGLTVSGCTSAAENHPSFPPPATSAAAAPLETFSLPTVTLDAVTSCRVRDAVIILRNKGTQAARIENIAVQVAHENSSTLETRSLGLVKLSNLTYTGQIDRQFTGALRGGSQPESAIGATVGPGTDTAARKYYLLVLDLQVTNGSGGPLHVTSTDIGYRCQNKTYTLQVSQSLTINAATCHT